MRDQYAGDISDVLKFAFLRALASNDRTLGIAWYYAPGDDGRADGGHLEWRNQTAWQQLDAELHAGLSSLSERSINALEEAFIWPPGVLFHREPVPSGFQRGEWAELSRKALYDADLVFLDPDNGLGKETSKHATLSEVRLLRRPNRAIVFITFPGRNKSHSVLLHELHQRLKSEAEASVVLTLRTCVSIRGSGGSYVPRVRWFTVVDPDATLVARSGNFARALSAIPRVQAELEG